MKIIPTPFEGLLVFQPDVFKDTRGSFYEDWHADRYRSAGLTANFVQEDFSISNKTVLRGLHGQIGQGKLIQTVHGCVWDVLVDLRPQSATFKQYFSITLSDETPTQVYAPDGFVHGFCVLSEMAIMHYKCTTFHDKTKEFGLRWNDPTFQINWPKQSFILSDKDAHQPLFNHELQS